jgi:hypothetical protein
MTSAKAHGTKMKFQLFSTFTGEEVTGHIINSNTAKVVFSDKTFEVLYLSYIFDDKTGYQEFEPEAEIDHTYRFTVMNFIQEGYVPQGHLRIVDNPTPNPSLVDKINQVLSKTNYAWSAKDQIGLSKMPIMTKKNGTWQNVIHLFVRVNGLQFGSIEL